MYMDVYNHHLSNTSLLDLREIYPCTACSNDYHFTELTRLGEAFLCADCFGEVCSDD
jgi:hypothetical protein